ncbi:DMT family transporter [Oceanihabitans sediminis]|uniref:EamA/RhaT family transporter n=1 Tax=Oceanihabitans sediminis TaxID=1812012 RepID=A0A368P4E6_9FLAO|nr:DMT family transporter [Oceanihabitans sediminis]MDX1278325.1 DMT family transporter [Oceanihabitans sediminis]MDX1773330.1 DMT family transporter [Oceanihabitans sediminis]RBP32762.1 drug/metabolite transporter (DMT)-like permease [Oceanihabitans sediminis]RCU57702.1 EamA/RhaT family transporter [Oceanihabitans sediminis]
MGKVFNNRWFLLLIITLTWGSSFMLIKKTLVAFTPYEIGAIRVVGSGLLLAFIGIPAIRKMSRSTLLWVTIVGFFGNFLPMFLFPIAQTRVSSSLAGILDSLVPIFVLIFGYIFFKIKSEKSQILGAIIGFIGATSLIYFSEANSETSQFAYAMLIVLAGASYGVNAVLIKQKTAEVKAVELTAAIYTVWAVPSLVILYATGFVQNFEMQDAYVEPFIYLLFLTTFGTAIAMLLYYKLIQNTSAVFASSVSYLLPIVAVIWGVIDGEKFTFWYILGGVLILIGIYLIREKRKNPKLVPRS